MNWIPCAERLPDDGGMVLLSTDDGEVWPGYVSKELGWRYYNHIKVDRTVTHWQPLPEPPA